MSGRLAVLGARMLKSGLAWAGEPPAGTPWGDASTPDRHRRRGQVPVGVERPRRWTGIEPAGRGAPVPAALKAVGPTRRPDTSVGQDTGTLRAMKRLVLLVAVLGLAAFAIRKVKGS